MGTIYGVQQTGALIGHAVATSWAGLIIYTTGSFTTVLILAIAFNIGGLIFIAMLNDTSHILIPDWEESLPPDAPIAKLQSR